MTPTILTSDSLPESSKTTTFEGSTRVADESDGLANKGLTFEWSLTLVMYCCHQSCHQRLFLSWGPNECRVNRAPEANEWEALKNTKSTKGNILLFQPIFFWQWISRWISVSRDSLTRDSQEPRVDLTSSSTSSCVFESVRPQLNDHTVCEESNSRMTH